MGLRLKKAYNSREIIALLRADGWEEDRVRGSHHQFIHKHKKGVVTVQHPVKDLSLFVTKSIFRQAGLKRAEN
ncbi:MAG TPA: type II toxin-antitoxin system HicA family toxin [Gammaproteobacteria bacterium]|nr:type II toxin-antitoxin system HicA family toxin [Gammaproteobacteria bacterium]